MSTSRARSIFVTIGWLLVTAACLAQLMRIVHKVSTGHGLDYYFTGIGVQFNYIGALVLYIIGIAAIPIALYLRVRAGYDLDSLIHGKDKDL